MLVWLVVKATCPEDGEMVVSIEVIDKGSPEGVVEMSRLTLETML